MSNDYSDINNYIMKKDLGEGNFGKVKLAIFEPTGEEFAIKILNKKKIKKQMKKQIIREKEIITKLNHINIVTVYTIIDTKEDYYIVMEYCKLGELFDYIVKKKKLSEEESANYFYQLINGVEYIHSQGFAHRDLKPENLLLTEDKVLKIIDFGLSHEFNDELFLKTKCGSPSYAAPELIALPKYNGFKIDIWCCGIILYSMLCGYLPFDTESETENSNIKLFNNILQCEPKLPDFLSDISKDLIYKILNPDPSERIRIKNIKKHPFYLKGKELCKIDYSSFDNEIIKSKESFSNKNNEDKNDNKNIINLIKDKSIIFDKNNNHNIITEGNIKSNFKNSIDFLSNNKYKFTINDENNFCSTSIDNNLNKVTKDKIQLISLKSKNKQKNEINSFKKYNPIKLYNSKRKKIENINSKVQQIINKENNPNKHFGLPFIGSKDQKTFFEYLSKKINPNIEIIDNSTSLLKGGDENKFINDYKSPVKYEAQMLSNNNKNKLKFKINSCPKNKKQNLLLGQNEFIFEKLELKNDNKNINNNNNIFQNSKENMNVLKEKMNFNNIHNLRYNQKGNINLKKTINTFSPGNIMLSLTNENNKKRKLNRYNYEYNFNTSSIKKKLIKELYTNTLNSTNSINKTKNKEIKTIAPVNLTHSIKKVFKKISGGGNNNNSKSPEIKSIYNDIKINININSNAYDKSRDKNIETLNNSSNSRPQYTYNIPQNKNIDNKLYMLTDSNDLNNDIFKNIVINPYENIFNNNEITIKRKGISIPKNNNNKNTKFNLNKIIQKVKNENLKNKENNDIIRINKSYFDKLTSMENEDSSHIKNNNDENKETININDKKKNKDDLLTIILFNSKNKNNNDNTLNNINNHFLPKLKDHYAEKII